LQRHRSVPANPYIESYRRAGLPMPARPAGCGFDFLEPT
jgi:hypothetical protein